MPPKSDLGSSVDVEKDALEQHPFHIDCYEFASDVAARLSEESIGEKLCGYFVDEQFNGTDAIYIDGLRPPQGALPGDLIQWKSLGKREVLGVDAPFLFAKENLNVSHLVQGQLNNKWLLNAIAGVRSKQEMLKELFVSSRYSSKGLYTIKLFKNGIWRYVHIDDTVPVDLSGYPIYATLSDPNEIWIMLLEKACAKLHGCYESLGKGFVDEAFRDLSGGAPLSLDLRTGRGEKLRQKGQLWALLNAALADGAIITSSRSANAQKLPGGLSTNSSCRVLTGNSYTVLFVGIVEDPLTKFKANIMRIRNPWGGRSWEGAWSVKSSQWEDYPKMKFQLKNMLPSMDWTEPDGTFLMDFRDFLEQYDQLSLLFELQDGWASQRIQGKWRDGSTVSGPGGAPRDVTPSAFVCNPQYGFSLSNESDVHIVLSQSDTRWTNGTYSDVDRAIGFTVCALSGNHLRVHSFWKEKVKNNPYWAYKREVSDRFTLAPGNYAIIPCTYEAGKQGEFFLDLFTSTHADVFDSMEEEDGKSDIPEEDSDSNENASAFTISNIYPENERLVDLALRSMQQTVSRLAISARALREEICRQESRIMKLETKI